MTVMIQDQWSSAGRLLGNLPNWVEDEEERRRIGAYALYEAIYWCVPNTFRLAARGTEDNPIYVPAGKVIVETINRFLCPSMQVVTDPDFGDTQQQTASTQVLTDLLRREAFYSKFNTNKRYGLMRGDWMFHVYANPDKDAGSRVSIMAVDPASVFAIHNPDNIDEVIGYHIAEQFKDNDGQTLIRRLTYIKESGQGGPSTIIMEDALFEVENWGGPGQDQDKVKLKRVLTPPTPLPSPIDDLPVYHIPNFDQPGSIWGSSEMRGLERLIAALNQSISDEDLALALEGLGVYWTDAGTPINEEGEEVAWSITPGKMLEIPDAKKVERLSGISSVSPYQDHLSYLEKWINDATGSSDIARGRVDVQVAESGVALALELAPLLARAIEKEQIVTDKLTQMWFNVPKWLVAYEGTVMRPLMETTRWIPTYGDRLPRNRDKEIDELLKLAAVPQLIPMSYVRKRLRELGYDDLPAEAVISTQIQADSQQALDAFASRIGTELGAPPVGAPAGNGSGG